MKYLYEGAQKPKGRPRKYDGKVDFNDVSRLEETTVKVQNKEVSLSSKVVWSVSLKRKIKLVVVKYEKKTVNLFSTDLDMSGAEIFWLYRSRFSIEFLIRDAKGSGGLSDCQARDNEALEFHWNAALTAVNFARGMAHQAELKEGVKQAFSMKTIKQQFYNEHLLNLLQS